MLCDGKIVVVPYKEKIPPNVTALQFLLMNRKSSKWKHHSKIVPPVEDDPFLDFLRSINGTAMRPRELNGQGSDAPREQQGPNLKYAHPSGQVNKDDDQSA